MLNAKKEETHLEKNDTAVKICGTTEAVCRAAVRRWPFPMFPCSATTRTLFPAGPPYPPFPPDLPPPPEPPPPPPRPGCCCAPGFPPPLAREGREKYQEKYGPLLQTDLTPGSYKWLDNPWPWDLGGND